jgi:DNA ligase-1
MSEFRKLASLADVLAAEGSKLKKRAAIAEAIAQVHVKSGPEDAGRFALYLAGLPFAESDPRKLNAGGALLSRAVLAVSGATDAALTAAYRRHGDLGTAAFELLSGGAEESQRAQSKRENTEGAEVGLTLVDVRDAFTGMAAARTTAGRAALVEGLLRQASPLEAKYLLKLMLGDMRIGVKQSLVEEAIAVAAEAEVEAVRWASCLPARWRRRRRRLNASPRSR